MGNVRENKTHVIDEAELETWHETGVLVFGPTKGLDSCEGIWLSDKKIFIKEATNARTDTGRTRSYRIN
jgi:hypothetical protein